MIWDSSHEDQQLFWLEFQTLTEQVVFHSIQSSSLRLLQHNLAVEQTIFQTDPRLGLQAPAAPVPTLI